VLYATYGSVSVTIAFFTIYCFNIIDNYLINGGKMVKSEATTVEQYLAELSPERREVIERVREVILHYLPEGYVETMNWGMISYEIPLAHYPDTYNGKPLNFAALAAQKNNYSLYLMSVYQNPALMAKLEKAYADAGVKPDIGKACLRFKKLNNIPLDAIGEIIASTPPAMFIAQYEASRKH
jgi:hypothetical protein